MSERMLYHSSATIMMLLRTISSNTSPADCLPV